MSKRFFCRRASELNLSKLGLDPEVYELIKDEDPAKLLQEVRNKEFNSRTKRIAMKLKAKYGIKTKVTLILMEQAREIVWKLEKQLLAKGFLREDICNRTLIAMHSILGSASCREYDWKKEYFITPEKQMTITKVYKADINSYGGSSLTEYEYRTIDFEQAGKDLLDLLKECLTEWQYDYFIECRLHTKSKAMFLTNAENEMEEAIIKNIIYWADRIREFYKKHNLLRK